MNRILREPRLQQQLSEASLNQAQKFSWAKTGAQTAAVLERFG